MRAAPILIALSVLATTACGAPPAPVPSSRTTVTAASTTTAASAIPFAASVNDVLSQLNLQLPLLATGQDWARLPTEVRETGLLGGQLAPGLAVFLRTEGNAFGPVRYVTVRVKGEGSGVAAPARLLGGVGVSLYAMSTDALVAFQQDALPKLSVISSSRSTITVGRFSDLTIVVTGRSDLAFVYTPVGVPAPVDVEAIGG